MHSIGHLRDEIRITPLTAALAFHFLRSENRVTVLFFMAEKEAKGRLTKLKIPPPPHIVRFVSSSLFVKGATGPSQCETLPID